METAEPSLPLNSLETLETPEVPGIPEDIAALPEVPGIADGVERSLDPRAVTLNRLVGGIVVAAISLGGLVALVIVLIVSVPAWTKIAVLLGWLALTLGLAGFAWRWPEVEHRHASYRVDTRGIEIRQGVVWRRVTHVPRSRVQHTDVSQGPLERAFGLGTLVLFTAGTRHARVDLSGLDHATALRIRDHFLVGDADDAV